MFWEISELILNLAAKTLKSLQRLSDHNNFQGREEILSRIAPRPKTLGCVWYFTTRPSWNCTAVNAWNAARVLLWWLAANMPPLFFFNQASCSGYYNWLTILETRGKNSPFWYKTEIYKVMYNKHMCRVSLWPHNCVHVDVVSCSVSTNNKKDRYPIKDHKIKKKLLLFFHSQTSWTYGDTVHRSRYG